jgi:dipeptidyl aminopeptidase/acylaminoacyl peptidase
MMPLLQLFRRERDYKIFVTLILLFCVSSLLSAQKNGFTMEQVMSYPFPAELTTATTGSRIAWTFNETGLRNIYVAEGPEFEARQLTHYMNDDGQAISSLSLSADGRWIIYIRGGDFGSNWDDALPVNPTFDPEPPQVQVWSISFEGGETILLGDGDNPVISPLSDQVAFVKAGQIWVVPVDGSGKANKLFTARGQNGSPKWSPDGSRLAFQSNRQDHSFIGIFSDMETPIVWIDPSFNRDGSPRWSPDGTKIAFIRTPGRGGAPDSILSAGHHPWRIMTASALDGKASEIWKAPETIRGSVPSTHGGTNLHWAAKNRIVFLSYHDGWPHLYSMPENGGNPILLTPGNFMAEYIHLSADRNWLVFAGNTGPDPLDIDRRHIVMVPVDQQEMKVMTPGDGLEWTPVLTGDGAHLVYLGATPQHPPLPAVMNLKNKRIKVIAEERIPENFPTKELVTPTQVIFKSTDGLPVHATLFQSSEGAKRKPAIIYVHGGPPRQMLLGWHYSSYYSNAYAVNQYLASKGFVVLSVNYRLGIGYGYEFHHPVDGGTRGASEYKDVKAAGLWLANQDFVDAKNIGIYGGSYGGYLTAMALGRDSELFAAGVDIHGVHDRTVNRVRSLMIPDQYEKAPDAMEALEVAWKSSPTSSVDTWTSPVLIIHADDDRNVAFSQSTDLVQRLLKKGVPTETIVIVDDTHHFMMHKNQLKVNIAVEDFLSRHLK